MSKIENYLWVEKYRPRELTDMVLKQEYVEKFNSFLENKEIPHLLFIGVPGSGKTTLARIIVDKILEGEDDCLVINGSTQTGVDVVRMQIEEYLKVPSFSDSKIKIVFIDEFDYMSQNAQAALRHVMEEYHEFGRFLYTANYESKIIDPIRSRTQIFRFDKLPQEFVLGKVKEIFAKEGVKFDENNVEELRYVTNIVVEFRGDIRRILNELQSSVGDDGKIIFKTTSSKEKLVRSYITDVIRGTMDRNSELVGKSFQHIQQIISKEEIDYMQLYHDVFNDDNVPFWAKIKVNEFQNKHANALIPPMNFMACIYELANTGQWLRDLKK